MAAQLLTPINDFDQCRIFSIFYNGRKTCPPKQPLPLAGYGPPPNSWFLGPNVSTPKWHLDRFSHFSTAHGRAQETDKHTDTYTHTSHGTSRTIGCLMLCIAMWPKNTHFVTNMQQSYFHTFYPNSKVTANFQLLLTWLYSKIMSIFCTRLI